MLCAMRVLRFTLAALIAAALAAPALASGEKEPAPGSSVEMPYLIAPITVDDKLVAYAYISSKIIATSSSAAIDVRDKTPFLQDAFLRDVNATSIGSRSDPAKVDPALLVARLLKDARRIVGGAKVANVAITQIQLAQLRPNPAK
jgi:hypothetical protein